MIPATTKPGDLLRLNGEVGEICWISADRDYLVVQSPSKVTKYWPCGARLDIVHRELPELDDDPAAYADDGDHADDGDDADAQV
jgi:hypothetical protein